MAVLNGTPRILIFTHEGLGAQHRRVLERPG